MAHGVVAARMGGHLEPAVELDALPKLGGYDGEPAISSRPRG
jgi:hypothetical protein